EAGYHVATTSGDVRCRTVVLASGACNVPIVPAVRHAVPASVRSVTAFDYRNPDGLPEGGVLVVGASATGVQLADEGYRISSGLQLARPAGRRRERPPAARGRRGRGVGDLRPRAAFVAAAQLDVHL